MRRSLFALVATLVPALAGAQPPAGQPSTGQPSTGTQQDSTRRTDSAGTRRRGGTGARARRPARDSAGTARDSMARRPGSTTPPPYR